MSVTNVENSVEALRAQAQSIQKQLAASTKSVVSDTSLSESGKRDQIAALKSDAKERLSELRRREENLIDDEISTLRLRIESRAGTSSSDIIAFRDAQDRADRLEKADEALPMLERALRQRDTSLAAAIFRRAIDARWSAVTSAYAAAHPESADLARDLNYLLRARENSFGRTMHYATFGG